MAQQQPLLKYRPTFVLLCCTSARFFTIVIYFDFIFFKRKPQGRLGRPPLVAGFVFRIIMSPLFHQLGPSSCADEKRLSDTF